MTRDVVLDANCLLIASNVSLVVSLPTSKDIVVLHEEVMIDRTTLSQMNQA